jgi:bisphosphoglycerate-independent phosphoglycerate mutase (AlkP superfamily)
MSDRLKPSVLLILDGGGHAPEKECNAIVEQTEYHEAFDHSVAYLPAHIENGLGKVLSNFNMKQLSLGETEKYVHVTCFLNDGKMRLIADHGNIHPMYDEETGQHPAAPMRSQVPQASICGGKPRAAGRNLSCLALTMLNILRIPQLSGRTGRSLLAAH